MLVPIDDELQPRVPVQILEGELDDDAWADSDAAVASLFPQPLKARRKR
jgi:hypothetical protein